MTPYPAYRATQSNWLSRLPAHWEEKRAKHYFLEVDQRSETGSEELLSVSHITGVTPRSEKNVTMFTAESYEGFKTCQPGDLVINIMWAWMGATGVSRFNGIVSSSYGVYRQRRDEFDWSYLDYLVRSKPYVAEYVCRSTGITSSRLRMYSEDFFDIPIICPPRDEQDTIVAFLDRKLAEIDRFIAAKERLIALLREQQAAIINRIVTQGLDPTVPTKSSGIDWLREMPVHWASFRLASLAESLQTGPFGSQLHESDYVLGGIPVINPSHMRESRIVHDPQCSVSHEIWERLQRHALKSGDILFARRGEMGRCALATREQEGWLCGTGSIRMRPKLDKVDSAYLILLFSSNTVSKHLSLVSVGSTMENLNTSILGDLRLPLPPLNEQLRVVEVVGFETNRVGKMIENIERQIALMGELRATLIADAVTGKIDVRSAVPAIAEEVPV